MAVHDLATTHRGSRRPRRRRPNSPRSRRRRPRPADAERASGIRDARPLTCIAFARVSLAGCSLVRPQASRRTARTIPSGSAVPQLPPDVLSIPDAVPQYEPRWQRGNPPFYEVFGKRYYVHGHRRRLRRARHGVLVRAGIPRRIHVDGRALRHVCHDGRAQDAAASPRMPRSPTCATAARWWCASTTAGPSSATASSTCRTRPRPSSTCSLQGTAPVEVRVITPRAAPGSAAPPVLPARRPARRPPPPVSRWSMRPR